MCDLLVLDDDSLVRTTLAEALREQGLVVVEAAAEAEALAYLREQEPPRILVTDLDLGTRRNGFVVAAMARMLLPELCVIYITGRPEAVGLRELDHREALLMKPFLPSVLVAETRRLMGAPRPDAPTVG
ncbi:response regulator [Rhizosaccharibacter radicis]|uniref:Response regulator n=1 Tax=Rhizosaccharibacter radicis TaxID=2782605 RepID=A0ABT1VX66_9PROT|nr:response regulator [Acetobacteraceae bacterium KSS12]